MKGAAAFLLLCPLIVRAAAIEPQELRVELQKEPLDVQSEKPRFNWTLRATKDGLRDLHQSAFRIIVATSLSEAATVRGDAWDSGKVNSPVFNQLEYAGTPLRPHQHYYWRVCVWDQTGAASVWSSPAHFVTGLFQATDWHAKWIAAEPVGIRPAPGTEDLDSRPTSAPNSPLPIFRHEFSIDKSVQSALVFISGLGQYELHVNGRGVTDGVMNPGWTLYNRDVLYNTYDVTNLLRPGSNAIGVLLGNGMYNVERHKGRYTKFIGTFGQPKLILQLHLRFNDGTKRVVVSDGNWTHHAGPITYSSIFGGEDYDATKEPAGWDQPNFREDAWSKAFEVEGPGGKLHGQITPPLRVAQVFRPVHVNEPKPGILVYDLGQNFSGWPKISVRGPAGAKVTMTPGELLDANGLVSQHSANAGPGDAVTYSYTLGGGRAETWHPRFSYYGFRYVQVEGAALESLEGEFVHLDASEAGEFATSDELFNRIHKLINMAVLSNLASILTDCPTREKLGWLEQTHLAGASIFLNHDVGLLYEKMARDMGDSQLTNGLVPTIAPAYVLFHDDKGNPNAFADTPEWGSALILSPWVSFTFTGDRQILSDSYEMMRRYAAFLKAKANGHLLSYGLGDWYDIGPKPPGYSQLTSQFVTATAIYYQDLKTLERIAGILNHPEDARAYASEAQEVKIAFNAELFNPQTNQYDRGSQTANAMPLALGLVPVDRVRAVADNLVADIRAHHDHVTAGDIGFHYVVLALTKFGRSDVLYDMLSRTDSPSYGYQLERGATALTEAWDTNPNSSQNHFMLGHAEEWFYRGLAGISVDTADPAGVPFHIRPYPVGKIAAASATYHSVLGIVRSSWTREGATFLLEAEIPAGTTATITVPSSNPISVTEGGKSLAQAAGVSSCKAVEGGEVCNLGSGTYHFRSSYQAAE